MIFVSTEPQATLVKYYYYFLKCILDDSNINLIKEMLVTLTLSEKSRLPIET